MTKPVVAIALALWLMAPAWAAEHHAARPLTVADAAAGKALYLRECSACHGEHGRGDGPAADFLEPRPRDFTKARFKYRSTESGTPPTTADVLRTVERGLPGTAMPSFASLMDSDRKRITAYVLLLANLLNGPEPLPIHDPGAPPAATPELLATGKQSYGDAGCASCHGDSGAGNGPSAKDLKDADLRPITPRDLTRGIYRGGGTPRDIFTRLATGLDGTPMPSYTDAIEPPELWAITEYVLSLRVPWTPPRHPADPLAAGRDVAAQYGCRGCHVLDDGRGGGVGPDLRTTARRRSPDWLRRFLKAPRTYGQPYQHRVYRMPALPLSTDDVEVMTAYLTAMRSKRTH